MSFRRGFVALPAAVCALATHALVYGTLWPTDSVHGYFSWYEPVVVALSLGSLVAVAASVVLASRGRRLPSFGVRARPLAAASLAFLLAQETLERSVALGRLAAPSLAPSQWVLLFVGIAVTALALSVALRAGHALAVRLVARPHVRSSAVRTLVALVLPARRRPLAERFGLRAPPLLPA
jgi:hypothetical protein